MFWHYYQVQRTETAAYTLSMLGWLCCVAVLLQSKCWTRLQVKNMLAHISYMVSATEMAWLLLWNTSNSIQFAEFQICKPFEDVYRILKGKWRPGTNICSTSMMASVALTLMWRILHCDGFYPYHHQRVQHLLPWEYANHVQFCEWLQPWLHILYDILLIDEAQFT